VQRPTWLRESLLNSVRGGTLLVVVAHPDDEVLGCGATVHKKVRQGWKAHLVLMTKGILGRSDNPEKPREEDLAALDALQIDIRRASDVIGFSSITNMEFPDNRMDKVSRMDLAHAVRSIIVKTEPNVVFTHHPGDYNWDHSQTFDAVMMAARINPPEFAPAEIRTFEVLSSTERSWQDPSRAFHANLYEDIGNSIDAKKLALSYYRTEIRPYPHARSIEAVEYLARCRGLEAGVAYAEAYHLIRRVER
jgi:N-acetylglucosamine malate deacetylase 1